VSPRGRPAGHLPAIENLIAAYSELVDDGDFADLGVPPSAITEGIAFAIQQPAAIDVNEIIVRSTAQP
jgi:NADP-dependent 3-hydroxy acid dehydrogenase YdfG